MPGERLCVLSSGQAGNAGTGFDFTQKSPGFFHAANAMHGPAQENDGKTRRNENLI
jgi:hypothetical protein